MRITLLCSDLTHPVYPHLLEWSRKNEGLHVVSIVQTKAELKSGDLLVLISCHEIVGAKHRRLFRSTLVIHASDLPEGRGWSPHIWQILEGRRRIPVTLLEAEDVIDSGAIWKQIPIELEGNETLDEVNLKLFRAELELLQFAVDNFGSIVPTPQDARTPTYYRRRTPEDSRLDPHRSIAEQFDTLRLADPARFPAYFEFQGRRYLLRLTKAERNEDD